MLRQFLRINDGWRISIVVLVQASLVPQSSLSVLVLCEQLCSRVYSHYIYLILQT